jgi:hypothetical protein
MTTQHNLSTADRHLRGNARNPGANIDGRRGIVIPFMVKHDFGAVDALIVDGICEAQTLVAPGDLVLDGSLVVAGVAIMDVPRTVEIDSTTTDTTQTATIYGTDVYGHRMQEDIAFAGTSAVAGLKAFKTVDRIAVDIALAGSANVGTTDELGLPYRIDAVDQIMAAAVDGSVEDVTLTVADTTDPATATDGDPRGTVLFTQTPNATLLMSMLFEVDGQNDKAGYGVPHFAD